MKMSLDEKRQWIRLSYVVIIYLSLTYIKKLLVFYDIGLTKIFSSLILYGGIIIFIGVLCSIYYLNKKYGTSNSEILRDKQVLILFIIIMILGIGINLINFF